MTQLLGVLNRIPSAHKRCATDHLDIELIDITQHHSDVPVPGSSPLQLLKKGAFIAGPTDFNRLQPYELFVLEVSEIN